MVQLEDENNVHDITEYSFALEVSKSHPKIINIYEKLLPVLYQFAAYQCVWPTIQIVEDSLLLARMQEKYYAKILANKGKIQG